MSGIVWLLLGRYEQTSIHSRQNTEQQTEETVPPESSLANDVFIQVPYRSTDSPEIAVSWKSPPQHRWWLRKVTSLKLPAGLEATGWKYPVLATAIACAALGRGLVVRVSFRSFLGLRSFRYFLSLIECFNPEEMENQSYTLSKKTEAQWERTLPCSQLHLCPGRSTKCSFKTQVQDEEIDGWGGEVSVVQTWGPVFACSTSTYLSQMGQHVGQKWHIPRAHWPANLAKTVSSRFYEKLCLKE